MYEKIHIKCDEKHKKLNKCEQRWKGLGNSCYLSTCQKMLNLIGNKGKKHEKPWETTFHQLNVGMKAGKR